MTLELFKTPFNVGAREELAPAAMVLRGFALTHEASLLSAMDEVVRRSPFRHMTTPGGFRMSVAMTNCGALGWVSEASGYRYDAIDPEHKCAWPPMPEAFSELARDAASTAGFEHFVPDACLVNCYEPGARLTLHQDKNERDYTAPIVSVSLGLPATFLFGGLARSDKAVRVRLEHGDVVVWGGEARLRYHGVLALKDGSHHVLGARRINLTFRKAG